MIIRFFMLLSLAATTSMHKKLLRVIDGRDVKEDEYPFVVIGTSVGDWDGRVFTASVITKEWVLTCAHCVDGIKHLETYIWYANFTIKRNRRRWHSRVLNYNVHPSYKAGPHFTDNDISLLRVEEITLQSYGKILSVDHTTLVGLPVTFVGGGGTNKPGDDQLRPLQVGEGGIIKCDIDFKFHNKHVLCFTPKCSNRLHRTEGGDSGGPLLYDNKIVGVLSYGIDNEFMIRDAYAPVSDYIDWISVLINGH